MAIMAVSPYQPRPWKQYKKTRWATQSTAVVFRQEANERTSKSESECEREMGFSGVCVWGGVLLQHSEPNTLGYMPSGQSQGWHAKRMPTGQVAQPDKMLHGLPGAQHYMPWKTKYISFFLKE